MIFGFFFYFHDVFGHKFWLARLHTLLPVTGLFRIALTVLNAQMLRDGEGWSLQPQCSSSPFLFHVSAAAFPLLWLLPWQHNTVVRYRCLCSYLRVSCVKCIIGATFLVLKCIRLFISVSQHPQRHRHRQRQCQRDRFSSRSFCSVIVVVSVNVSVAKPRLAAFTAPSSSTMSMSA
jgi:hypothetical protein